MKMEYTAMVRRGWPNEGALDRAEPIKAGATLVNGDWVVKQTDGTVDKGDVALGAAAGLVFSGNGDAASSANTKLATVLWSNFIVDTSNYAAGAWAPGSPVTIKAGRPAIAVVGTDEVVGRVLDVVPVGPNETAHLTILVK